MRKLIYILPILLLSVTSCLKSDLDELPAYEEAEMTDFDLEYRFAVKNSNEVDYLMVVTLTTSPVVDEVNSTITLSPKIPSPTGDFTVDERKKVSLTSIVGYAKVSPAAKVEPIEGAPVLGKPGDFTASRKYRVTAADGKTSKVWTIIINPLPIISQYEGFYIESGTLVRGTEAPENLNAELYLSTIDANTVQAQAGKSVFNNPQILYRIKVNTDNTVTILSDPDASVTITPQAGVPSTYDPATKTFDLHYEYTTSARRKFDTKLALKN
ncbi:MAG: BT_3044 domain-containing protein [Mangrovibacterium sp.]